jgi:hypothetical protein
VNPAPAPASGQSISRLADCYRVSYQFAHVLPAVNVLQFLIAYRRRFGFAYPPRKIYLL